MSKTVLVVANVSIGYTQELSVIVPIDNLRKTAIQLGVYDEIIFVIFRNRFDRVPIEPRF